MMLAVIHRIPQGAKAPARVGAGAPSAGDQPTPGLFDVAGVPLIARQIDWLRAVGASPIVVEIGDDEGSGELCDWILDVDEDGLMMVPTSSPLGPRALAARAGSPEGIPFLAVPENVIGDGDLLDVFLKSARGGAIVLFQPPRGVTLPYGSVRIVGERGGSSSLVQGKGWAVRLGARADARALGNAALRGLLPPRDRDHYAPLEVVSPFSDPSRVPSSGVHAIASSRSLEDEAYARIANAAGIVSRRP